MRHADCGQGLAGYRYRLHIGRRTGGTDQLGPDLPELALRPHLRCSDAQHLTGIAQAQRPRPVRQPGRGDAGDLRRHVGAHRNHPVRDRVHRAERVARHAASRTRQQRLLELDDWRLDPLVAVRREHADQPPGHRGLDLRLGRQQVIQSGRQQRGMRCVIHRRADGAGRDRLIAPFRSGAPAAHARTRRRRSRP